jgi:hypothetical protein
MSEAIIFASEHEFKTVYVWLDGMHKYVQCWTKCTGKWGHHVDSELRITTIMQCFLAYAYTYWDKVKSELKQGYFLSR